MTDIPSYQEAFVDPDKVLEFKATAGLRHEKWGTFFNQKSVEHPAKLNLALLNFLLDQYSKPGDIVMDMFAGTGSTGVMAVRKQRHAILCELEEDYIKEMIEPNIHEATAIQTLTDELGEARVLQVDSRDLSEHVPEAIDSIITSPPYSKMRIFRSDSKERTAFFKKQLEEKGYIEYAGKRYTKEEWLEANHGGMDGRSIVQLGDIGYSGDPDNLGNLDHGDIDAVITSPPYGTLSVRAGGGSKEVLEGRGLLAEEHLHAGKTTPYSDNDDNIENLPRGDIDAVIASPPYGQMELSKKFKTEEEKLEYAKKLAAIDGRSIEAALANIERWADYEESEGQIAKMPHGDVDAVISSPPYGEGLGHGSPTEMESDIYKDKHLPATRYNRQNPDNIGSMPHGDSVDTVISSPPYGATLSERSGGDDRPEAMRKVLEDWGYSPRQIEKVLAGETNIRAYVTRRGYNYSADDDNIGNLPTGEIDSVISSPPYEGTLEERGGTQEKFREEKGTPAPYSKDPENLGNKTGETYLSAMLKVYEECFKVIKSGGVMVLITKNFVRNKKPVRLDLDTIRLCEHVGFELLDRWWFKLPHRSFWAIQHTSKFIRENPDAKEHPFAIYEDCLVFSRP